jgi:hypothetical protein
MYEYIDMFGSIVTDKTSVCYYLFPTFSVLFYISGTLPVPSTTTSTTTTPPPTTTRTPTTTRPPPTTGTTTQQHPEHTNDPQPITGCSYFLNSNIKY